MASLEEIIGNKILFYQRLKLQVQINGKTYVYTSHHCYVFTYHVMNNDIILFYKEFLISENSGIKKVVEKAGNSL